MSAKKTSGRPLTEAERNLAGSVFGRAIDYSTVTINKRRWFPFQPKQIAMAPDGHLWFHPRGDLYCDDFCGQSVARQALFIHEMTHIWQRQRGVFLPLARHPFCRYDYTLKPGWGLERYGIEQQAEIVKHAWLLREGHEVAGAPGLSAYESILPFLRD